MKKRILLFYIERPTDNPDADKFLGIDRSEYKEISCTDSVTRNLYLCDYKFIQTLEYKLKRKSFRIELFINEGFGVRRYHYSSRRDRMVRSA
ncbi:hypothetical protein KW796_03045 [Candidatus Parcubacteria bacterium]|nr:hypothetical protein [Candidatus Parcubacteria bacterium]